MAFGQETPSHKEMIYLAYVAGRPDLWKKEIVKLNDIYLANPGREELDELIMARYGYIPFCIQEGEKKEVSAELEEARKNLEVLREADPNNPEADALEAAFNGFEMVINPFRGIFLAAEAKELTDKAYEDDPGCLTCISVKANQLNFTPAIFGGSTEEAIPFYKEVISLYESGQEEILYDWNYLNTMVIMAGAYEKLGQYNDACAVYEKILVTEPGLNWVRNNLYPACLKKAKKNNN